VFNTVMQDSYKFLSHINEHVKIITVPSPTTYAKED